MNNETSFTPENEQPTPEVQQPEAIPAAEAAPRPPVQPAGTPVPPPPPPPGYWVPPYPPYGAVPVQPVQPVRRRQYTFSQKMMAIAMVVFGYLFQRVFFFEDGAMGKTVFTLLLVLVSAIYMGHTGVKPGKASVAAGFIAAALSVGFAFGLPGGMSFVLTVVCAVSYIYFVYKAYDTGIEKAPGRFFDMDVLKAIFIMPFTSFVSLFPALFSVNGDKSKRVSKKILLVLVGLLISIIPTAIIVALLSYDEGFTALLDKVTGIDLLQDGFGSHVAAFWLGIPVAMYLYGLWTGCTYKACAHMNADSCGRARDRGRILPQILALGTVTPILFVYVLFFISQIEHYMAAFAGVLPEGYSYAEFARNGFFELCGVIAINSVLALLLFLLVKHSGRNMIARAYTALLSVSTLILTATAAAKMMLYVSEYGLTLRRVCTLWFMVSMALIFLVLLVQCFVRKLPLVPIALSVVLVLFGAGMLCDLPTMVSNYNTQQVLAGADWELDEAYFRQLGDAGVEDAVLLAKDESVNKETRKGAIAFLKRNKHVHPAYNPGIQKISGQRHQFYSC